MSPQVLMVPDSNAAFMSVVQLLVVMRQMQLYEKLTELIMLVLIAICMLWIFIGRW